MAIPNTATRTDHALSIRVDGVTIGHIQEWTPSMGRTVTPVYELNSATTGEVIENVPGNISGLSITVNRFDLFSKKMEEVWGRNFNIQMLTDQTNPITIQEKWLNPSSAPEIWIYTGCWFTSLGRTASATADRITKANGAMMYVKKYRAA
jgi:hypothetical protein